MEISLRILDISPFGVYPPRGGGHLRIHELNLEISKKHKIFLFSQGMRSFEFVFPPVSWQTKINSNYLEYRFASISSLIANYLASIINVPPIYSSEVLKVCRPKILERQLKNSDLVKVEHPWQFAYMHNLNRELRLPMILVEIDVGFDLMRQTTKGVRSFAKPLLKTAKEKEKFAVESADAVFVVSEDDMKILTSEFNSDKSRFHIIPNGVDTSTLTVVSREEREEAKKRLGLQGKKVILFTGSKHPPNFQALREILRISRQSDWQSTVFLIAGRLGEGFRNTQKVIFSGYVNDIQQYFRAADVAINPMISGSGTNVKMLQYLASGIPTITTPLGAQGLGVEDGRHVILSDINDFQAKINELMGDEVKQNELCKNGRLLVEERYDWRKVAQREIGVYERLMLK